MPIGSSGATPSATQVAGEAIGARVELAIGHARVAVDQRHGFRMLRGLRLEELAESSCRADSPTPCRSTRPGAAGAPFRVSIGSCADAGLRVGDDAFEQPHEVPAIRAIVDGVEQVGAVLEAAFEPAFASPRREASGRTST